MRPPAGVVDDDGLVVGRQVLDPGALSLRAVAVTHADDRYQGAGLGEAVGVVSV
jgi:hypothetical protein